MVELIINGETVELQDKANDIRYTKQIADIFDIAAIANSYTNSFTIPKTPNNTRIFQQLGIAGDTSRVPYSKVPIAYNDDGFPVISSGWLKVKDTTDNYSVSVIDGVIDFFKAIENKTLGSDVNLTQFDHEKNIATVVDSFTNEFYKYIFADYNGKNFYTVDDQPGINIDYLVPCFNVGKLFELVMSTFGYTYDTTNIEELGDLYITYPKPPADTTTDILFAELVKGNYNVTHPPVNPQGFAFPVSEFNWDSSTVTEGELIDNWKYKVTEDFAYKIDVSVETYGFYVNQFGSNPVEFPIYLELYKNGNSILQIITDPFEPRTGTVSIFCVAGDILEVRIFAPYYLGGDPNNGYHLYRINHNSTNVKIYRTNDGNIVLADAFKDFGIKDFIKECFWVCAVTPNLDNVAKHMTFISLSERIDFIRAVDWSEKYVSRTKEDYESGLAQKNIFKHKHNDENQTYGDGYLFIEDQNISSEKIIVPSKIYAPDQIRTTFPDVSGTETFNTFSFPIWQRESKEDADGNISIQYKGLNNRFFFVKTKQSPVSEWFLVSEKVIGTDTVAQIPYADTTMCTYSQIVPERYSPYSRVLNNFRAHDITLALSQLDFMQVDLSRPVFFEQESMYYMLNKLTYMQGSLSQGEFIRISGDVGEVQKSLQVQLMANDGYHVRIKIPIIDGYDTLILENSSAMVNGVEMELSSVTTDSNFITCYILIDVGDWQLEPVLSQILLRISNGEVADDYAYNGVAVTFTISDQSFLVTKTITTTTV